LEIIGVKESFIFYQMSRKNINIQIYKTISYRILGSLTTVILSLILGLEINWAVILGLGELTLKPILYFLHETFWDKYKQKIDYTSDRIF
jgi:uncharacterized membrane protein